MEKDRERQIRVATDLGAYWLVFTSVVVLKPPPGICYGDKRARQRSIRDKPMTVHEMHLRYAGMLDMDALNRVPHLL